MPSPLQSSIRPTYSLHVLNALQKPDVGLGQSVGSRAIPQQGDVPQRRISIHLVTLCHLRHDLDNPAITIFGLDLNMPVPAPRYSFRRVQAQQVASRDPVKYAPNLRAGVGVQINR